jgi:hypothetical protein
VMRIPYLMPALYSRCHVLHVQKPAKKYRPAEPGETAAPNIDDREVPAYLGKAVRAIVGRGVESNLVAAKREGSSKRNALPLSAPLDQQFMHD